MRLGTLVLILLLAAACRADPEPHTADPVPTPTAVAGTELSAYALTKAQVGHVLRYLEPPPAVRVTDHCLTGPSERCDLQPTGPGGRRTR